MPKILIGADIVPTISNEKFFENAQMEQIVDAGIRTVLSSADYRIFNLEVPLTDKQTPIVKNGPNLIASTRSGAGLKQLGIDFLTLANNHIMDQGEQGLWSTTEQLERLQISYAGVGRTLDVAAKPFVLELNGAKVGIYCCAEHEFSIVSGKQSGANPMDPLESLDHIASLKAKCDYVICLHHGGKEHYRYPSPNLQKLCRKMVEKGADLVVCQHTHCIGCQETWQDGVIVYGQGNFLFDDCDDICWLTSVLIQADVNNKKIELIPICKNGNGVALASDEDAEKILADMAFRSEQIQQPGFVERKYTEFAESMLAGYISATDWLATTFLFRAVNKVLGNRLKPWLVRQLVKKHRMKLINQFDCEAHRELILRALVEYEA